MIQRVNTLKKLISKTLFPFVIILLIQISALTSNAQQVILCYPQSIPYWTGTCSNTAIRDEASLVKWKADGSQRGWFMFDVSSIPVSATIDSVILVYYCNTASGAMNTIVTPLNMNPSTTTLGNTIWSAIGSATPYVTVASTAANLEQGFIRKITIGSPLNAAMNVARVDLKNSIGNSKFAVGMRSSTGSTPYRWANGYNQTNVPYLRVVYTPASINDAGIDSITSPKNLYCAGSYPVIVKLRNAGGNNINSVLINWSVNGGSTSQYSWIPVLPDTPMLPGQTRYVTLTNSYNFNGGPFTVVAGTTLPNGVVDLSINNDSKTFMGQILYKPSINLQPIDLNTIAGGAVTFTSQGYPIGVTYQWQVSTDGGLTFTDLVNNATYANVNTKNLSVSGITQGMNGYEYRCVIANGVCPPPISTDTVALGVGPPVHVSLANGYSCPAGSVSIPMNVTNMNSVYEINLTMNYNPAVLSNPNYISLNAALSGGTVTLTESPAGHLNFHWIRATPATIASGKICDLTFSYASGVSTMIFDTINPAACKFSGLSGLRYPADFHNGNVFNNYPQFAVQPPDPPYAQITDIGGSAMFYTVCSGAPVFTWQVSTAAPYTTWTNLATNPVLYPQGVHNDTLWITNALQLMDNYKYRCKAVACGDSTFSNPALLQVKLTVKVWLDTIHACHGTQITFSCKVRNWINVNSFSGKYFFKNSALTFISSPYSVPNTGGNFLLNSYPTIPVSAWNVYAGAWFTMDAASTLPNETVLFTMKYNFIADSTILQWETWTPGNCQLSDYDGNELNSIFQNGYALDAAPKVTTNPINKTIASGDTTTFTAAGNGWQGVTFSWEYSTNGSPPWNPVTIGSMYSVLSSASSSILTVMGPTQAMTNYRYRCKVSGLCTPAYSTAAILTVTPPPVRFIAPIVYTCLGDTIFVDIKATDFTTLSGYSIKLSFDNSQITYDSYKNRHSSLTPAGFSITNLVAGQVLMTWTNATAVTIAANPTLFTLKFVTTNQVSLPITLSAQGTPATYLPGPNLTPKYTHGTITTSPLPAPHNITTPSPADGHFCAGGSGAVISMDFMEMNVNYALYNNGVLVPGYESVPGTGQPQPFGLFNTVGTYTVVATNASGGCYRNMDGQVIIASDPAPAAVAVTGGGAFCAGGSGINVGLANSTLGVVYILFRDGVRVDSTAGTGAALNLLQSTTGTYTWKAKNAFTNTCLVNMTGSAVVTVNPIPSVNQPANASACNGTNTSVISFTGSGTSYNWVASTNIGAGLSGSGTTLASFAATNATSSPIVSTFGVTPVANGCSGPLKNFTFTVNPSPTITETLNDQTKCAGASTSAISFTGPVGGTAFNWAYLPAAPTIGVAASGSGNIPVFATVNATSAPIVANFTVTPVANTCTGTAKTFKITVNPVPSISVPPVTQTLCHGFNTTAINFTGPVTGTNFGWTNSSPSIGLLAGGSGNIASFAAQNTGATQVTGAIVVTPTANGCTGSTASFNIVVNPIPNAQLQAVTPAIICKDVPAFNLLGTPAGGTYTGSLGITNASTGAFNPSLVSGSQTITYSLTLAGCTGSSTTTFTVVAKPKISGSVNYDVAAGNPLGNILITRQDLATSTPIDNTTSAIAGTPGSYEFRCVDAGTFRLVPTTTRPWGSAANAVDALLAMKYSVRMITLSSIRIKAADVNGSHSVTSIDALLITKRFTSQISTFPVGDWVFELSDTVPVATTDMVRQILSLKAGDVNADNNPSVAKLAPGIRMQTAGLVKTENASTFEIPVRPAQELNLGAMSIVLYYPASSFEVTGLSSALENFEYGINAGEIRIAWYSLTPMTFSPSDAIFTIKGRVLLDATAEGSLSFEPGIECELADADGKVLPVASLVCPAIEITNGQAGFVVPDPNAYYLGSNYPNPFSNTTDIPYYLPEDASVSISLQNLTGESIRIYSEGDLPQGTHKLVLDGKGLAPGMYLYSLTARGKNSHYNKTRTLIINK